MTADLHLWPYTDGKVTPIPFSASLIAFSDLKLEKLPNRCEYRVSDKQGQLLCHLWVGDAQDPQDKVRFVAIYDPARSPAIWEAIFRYLSSNRMFLIWSRGSDLFAAIGSDEILEHVPDNLIAEVHSVKVVASGEELLAIVEKPIFC